MTKEFIDLILDYRFRMYYAEADEWERLKTELYQKSENLYLSDPESFHRMTLALLNEHVPILEETEYQIKMECAQIWHKNGFDAWIFRIRYYLNISPEEDSKLLEQKIKKAFSHNSSDVMKTNDMRKGYEGMFYQILSSDAPEDQTLRSTLEKLLTVDLAKDIDGVITYVTLKDYAKEGKKIPAYIKTIYTAVTNIAVIEGDGLRGWLIENRVNSVRSVSSALKKLGLNTSAEIMSELYEFLKHHPDVIRSDQIADESIAKQIEAYEERLSGSLNGEKLQVAAERYLDIHRKTD